VALDLGGTLSGEHGVGTLKRPYMERALGPVSIDVQRRIKQALDPLNIMNPGKVLPSSAGFILQPSVARDLSCNYPQDESYATSPCSAGFILQLPTG
jgi:hypothetical protein